MKQLTLVNLGAVEKPGDIFPFLFNMFSDRHILPLKQPIRSMAALLITALRFKETLRILKQSPSPLIEITKQQAEKLSKKANIIVEYAFTYSKPNLKEKSPPFVVMQNFYSHTTHAKVIEVGKTKPPLCIYHGFFDLFINRLENLLKQAPDAAILFSAHSLPVNLVKKTRDPYPHDLKVFKKTMEKILKRKIYLSFQSKLGPIEWLKPYTEEEIKRLSKLYKELIIVPVSFTTDNTETVVEIDKTYINLARSCGFKRVLRMECFNSDEDFIDFLSKAVQTFS